MVSICDQALAIRLVKARTELDCDLTAGCSQMKLPIDTAKRILL